MRKHSVGAVCKPVFPEKPRPEPPAGQRALGPPPPGLLLGGGGGGKGPKMVFEPTNGVTVVSLM